VCDWRLIAGKLLNEAERRGFEAGAGVMLDPARPDLPDVPIVKVLRLWRSQQNSTVNVLREMLDEVATDLVQEFDNLRMSKYD